MPAADFSADELLYLPRNLRAHKLYGFSPVEQIALTVNIALRREAATLDYYRSGSTPDAFATLPKEWTVDQIRQFQDYFDALMSGNSARRRMTKFMAADFRLIEARQPPLKDQYDEWLARRDLLRLLGPRFGLRQPGQPRHQRDAALAGDAGGPRAAEGVDQGRARPGDPGLPRRARPRIRLGRRRRGRPAATGADAEHPRRRGDQDDRRGARRAGAGGGGEGRAGVRQVQSDPDERGRFATAPGASPAATQVAADDAPTATQSSTRTQSPGDAASAPPDKPTPPKGLTIVHGAPEDAVSLTAGDGTPFYAPPHADFCKVYAAGQANWQNPIAAYLAVGQFGTYDFQRDNEIFYSAYTNASNYAVGVYMSGAGYSYHATVVIGHICKPLLFKCWSREPDNLLDKGLERCDKWCWALLTPATRLMRGHPWIAVANHEPARYGC